MKKFTIKDFIVYNNPCFSCNSKVNIEVFSQSLSSKVPIKLIPMVTSESLDVQLRLTYSNALKLKIYHKTNKFYTNNLKSLTKYLEEHKLFLLSFCSTCLTTIESQYLDFNYSRLFILPFGLSKELLIVRDSNATYWLNSFYFENKSTLLVSKNDFYQPTKLELSLLPLYRFSSKESFLSKMKTYLLFS